VTVGRPFEPGMGTYPIDRLSKKPKATIVASENVLPIRMDPSLSGCVSRILKDGMPSALVAAGASAVTASIYASTKVTDETYPSRNDQLDCLSVAAA